MPGLTGLRGYAALAVLLYHHHVPGFGHGWLAVDVFFALSGYVLAHVYRDGLCTGDFLWARFARIAPVHIATTAMVGAFALALGAASFSRVLASFTFIDTINNPAWSLRYEFLAYIAFALLVPLRPIDRTTARVLVALGGALGLVGAVGTAVYWGDPAWTKPLLDASRGFGWFVFGVGLYHCGARPVRCRLLDNPAALWLGEISYPLYLGQFLPILVFGRGSLAPIVATFGLAIVLHHGVEIPARCWLRRIAGTKKAGAGSLPAGL